MAIVVVGVSFKLLEGKPRFVLGPAESLTAEKATFVREAVDEANEKAAKQEEKASR
jgi:hypothetical protein